MTNNRGSKSKRHRERWGKFLIDVFKLNTREKKTQQSRLAVHLLQQVLAGEIDPVHAAAQLSTKVLCTIRSAFIEACLCVHVASHPDFQFVLSCLYLPRTHAQEKKLLKLIRKHFPKPPTLREARLKLPAA
jgi:hypothetical protein